MQACFLPVADGLADGQVSLHRERQSHEDRCVEGDRRHGVEEVGEQGVEGLKQRGGWVSVGTGSRVSYSLINLRIPLVEQQSCLHQFNH